MFRFLKKECGVPIIAPILQWLKPRLGVLGWGALIVFLILRLGDLANLAARFYLGRVLPPLEFGAFDPVLGILAVMALPTRIIYQTGVKTISRLQARGEEAKCRAVIQDMMCLAMVGSLLSIGIVSVFRHLILTRLHLEDPSYLWMMGGLFVLAWWIPLGPAIIQGKRHYRLMLVPSALSPVIYVIVTLILVEVLGLGLKGALIGRITKSLVTIILMFVFLKKSVFGKRESYRDEWGVMARLLFPMAAFIGSMVLLTNFEKLYVRNFLIEDSAGFGAIVTVGTIPTYLVGAIVFVIFPLAAAEHASGRQVRRLLRQGIGLGAAITAACTLGAFLLAAPFFTLWNPAFTPYSSLLWVYTLTLGLQSVISILGSVEMARHRYQFLWALAIPTLLYCGGLYISQDRFSLQNTLWIALSTRVLALIGVFAMVWRQEHLSAKTVG